MNSPKARRPIRPQVLEEAAGWIVEFRAGDPDPTECRSFDAWLRTSPEHVSAYLTLLPSWENEALGELQSPPGPETLIQWARAPEGNVVRLDREARPVARSRPKRAVLRFAVAAALLMALGVAGYSGLSSWRSPIYTTGIGEQTAVSLPDGTAVNLNSRTRIRLRYSDRERRVELLQGQALFEVVKDARRPFIVSADTTQVRAVGTQFDVYKKPTGTVVTVVEGRVAVHGTLLSAGEQLTVAAVNSGRTSTPTRVNPKTATAWTEHRLIFSAAPLSEVAVEFNRYNTRQLVIDDTPKLQAFRINGVFSSADPTALLGFLREQPGIAVTESGQDIHVSQK